MHLPKVDVLFRLGAPYAGADAVGVVMTGMGDYSAHGRRTKRPCVVFGMPNGAVALDAAMKATSLSASPVEILHARVQT